MPQPDPTPFARAANLTNVSAVASGLNFSVFRADSPDKGEVALRIPSLHSETITNINDSSIPVLSLLLQETAIYDYLVESDVPSPLSYGVLEAEGRIASLASFIPSDGSAPDPLDAGRVLARLHNLAPPKGLDLTVQHDVPIVDLLSTRLTARWASLSTFVPNLPSLPPRDRLVSFLRPLARFPDSLLHMDFRDANLRTREGRIIGVLDWENALIGPGVVDLMRVLEIGGFDETIFRQGYAELRGAQMQLNVEEEVILRLDAAVMLALVFFSESPDAERAEQSVVRVRHLLSRLTETIGDM